MKKLLLLSLLFFVLKASGQYKSIFHDSGSSWYIVTCYADAFGTTICSSDKSDTVSVDTNLYNLVRITDQPSSVYSDDTVLLREDTIAGKLYIHTDSIDYLIMDLTLSIGDTFSPLYDNIDEVFYVVDTVEYFGDDSLKVITFNKKLDCFYNSLQFIESIGPTNFLDELLGFGDHNMINCKYDGILRIYHEENDIFPLQKLGYKDECIVSGGGGIDESNLLKVQLYPNPSNGFLNLKIDDAVQGIFTIEVFKAQSQLVLKRNSIKNQFQFELLEKGLYFINVRSKSGGYISKKLVII